MSKITITFLGTGPAVAIPRFGHKDCVCRAAREIGNKTKRMRSSILVSQVGQSILFDAGPDFLKQLENNKKIMRDLKAVFLTHEHLDAIGGLHDLNNWLKIQNKKIVLYCLKETWKRIADPLSNLKIIYLRPYIKIRIKNLVVLSFRVRHGIKHNVPTLGFQISIMHQNPQEPSRIMASFIYASDMDGAPAASKKFFHNASLVIIDSAIWFGKKFNGHFNPAQALNFLLRLKPKRVILTQIGHSWPPSMEAARELQRYCEQNKIPFPVVAAHDGYKLELG